MQPETKQVIVDFFLAIPGTAAVYLFGSQLTPDRLHPGSDIDLAVLFEHEKLPNPLELLEIRERLSELLKIDLDLVSLNENNPIVGMQILEKGQLILNINPRANHEWAMRLITDYADLKHLRKPTEEGLLRSLRQ